MLVLLFATLIGLALGLLGGGGSILTVPLLIVGLGMEPKAAMATALLIVGLTSTAAVIAHARRGEVAWKAGLPFSLAAMLGGYAGGALAGFVPARWLVLVFALLMLGTALAMLRGRGTPLPDSAAAKSGPFPRVLCNGLLVGSLTGLVGAGGGFLVVPALHLLGALPMHVAVATSVLVIALKSFAGLAGYLQHVAIDLGVVTRVTPAAVVGTVLGGILAGRISAARLRQGFAFFVLATAGLLGYHALSH